MYKGELDKHIQNDSISNSFVFFGESSFLIDTYTKKLSNIEDASALTFYYDEYDFKSAKAHLSQASLFGGQNVLVIKSEKKVPKKELDDLIDLCEKNQDNFFIYAYYGSDHKTYSKAFSKNNTMSVRFFSPNHHESINIIADVVKEKNVNMDKYSIAHLLNIHNGDVALAYNEIEKFRVYDKVITTKDIEHLVSGLGEISMDDLLKKILSKKDFTKDLINILEHGEDEIRVATALTAYLTQLYMFNIYIRVNGAPNALEILGYPAPKFVVDEKAALSLKFKPNTYYKLHELLLESELKMKSAGVDKSAILLSTLIRVQKLL
ncbi:DNA polymerase III, subunit delta [Sulfurimonas gotlandica GD1]|uniref:DNA polymerase III, subunit delta n=1 Tax=Sulfurimonas gotlandica (strain DSM 19862 / JCM 16533 / GD1) TaxID=929558 RepID=B6BIS0_SULGG|nr:DNA polymerase III subunit delta [Sulfurimonas gotlandica]EDZ63860.1 DNA polymerase III, delta [Sulfurimonas gotlandica GD1]EHP30430.1 DNA polymerase III, subunit delta [Sulfurimonas gotlandica GD1]